MNEVIVVVVVAVVVVVMFLTFYMRSPKAVHVLSFLCDNVC